MPVTISGSTGIAGVDGSAGTPSVQGADTNTGMFFPAADTIAFAEGGAEVMRIDSSGNVGIGTSSPGSKLHVKNSSNAIETYPTGTWAGQVYNASDSSAQNGLVVGNRWAADTSTVFEAGSIYGGGSGSWRSYYKIDGVGQSIWSNNGSELARIDSSGNFLINTTDTTLYNNTSGYGVCYRVNASFDVLSTSDNAVILNRTGTDGGIEEFRKSGTIVGSISVTGSATAYNTSSDYRLKENVQPMSNGLATVSALKPVRYDWVRDRSVGEGFIAHELQEIIPQAVTGDKDAVNADGSIKPQGVDYSKVVVHLVAAIQELKAQNDELKARVEALEAK
jgi:hypothetical protein